jgi:hypothetical protein
MNEWDALLRQLADNPDEDYERDGGSVMLVRQGQERNLTLKTVPGIGVAVEAPGDLVPVARYIQKELLGLHRLAGQIARTLERVASDPRVRPTQFVEGPAECVRRDGKEKQSWDIARAGLSQHLVEKDAGTTRLVQLMAPAGQGKTVLLEQIALENARGYKPDAFPVPLLLPVDLLGRFVGSIADAIAGSLNNTYTFPSLTQRDVIECIRHGWLILALDGFDELVARVGSRDAFLAISALLEQLQGSGAIVISARETFFELYQITAAIRTYLRTNQGTYDVSRVKLLPWSRNQGIKVFQSLGSQTPDSDLDALRSVFDGDDDIVFQPFFLTRLASLWQKGERFAGAGTFSGRFARIHYVIETFIQRESTEKWRDRDGNPLLSAEGHNVMLGSIAEEMWRSSAFRLQADELSLAAELGILRLGATGLEVEKIKALIPTHAVISSVDKTYSFRHDRFFHFFLGYGTALHLHRRSPEVRAILDARELGPEVIQWIVWHSLRLNSHLLDLLRFLTTVDERSPKGILKANIAALLAKYMPHLNGNPFEVRAQTFAGDVFSGNAYQNVQFHECEFWTLDICGTTFEKCLFSKCSFGDVSINTKSAMPESQFVDCRFLSGVEHFDDETSVFTPADIEAQLGKLGASVRKTEPAPPPAAPAVSVSQKAINAVERYVRGSMSTCDVAVEDLEDRFGEMAESIAKIGVSTGVFRSVTRPTSGPKKTLVRFQVDRERLRRGHLQKTGENRIDAFWTAMAKQYPA